MIHGCDLVELGEAAQRAALRLLDAERAPSGKLPLIADKDLTGVYIHEALGHPCEADLVARAILAWMENSVKRLATNWSPWSTTPP